LRRGAGSEGFEVERNKLKLLPPAEKAAGPSEPKEETALGERPHPTFRRGSLSLLSPAHVSSSSSVNGGSHVSPSSAGFNLNCCPDFVTSTSTAPNYYHDASSFAVTV